MVDATDSKSVESNLMWVQVPPPAPMTYLFELTDRLKIIQVRRD